MFQGNKDGILPSAVGLEPAGSQEAPREGEQCGREGAPLPNEAPAGTLPADRQVPFPGHPFGVKIWQMHSSKSYTQNYRMTQEVHSHA